MSITTCLMFLGVIHLIGLVLRGIERLAKAIDDHCTSDYTKEMRQMRRIIE